MLDGFVAAITGPFDFEADGDHVLVTLKSGRRRVLVSMSRNDLLATIAEARKFVREWDDNAATIVPLKRRG